jgi:hypothetical protein
MTPEQLERIKAYIGKAKYDSEGQNIWATQDLPNNNRSLQMLCDVRGWGRIQNMFPTEQEAAEFQDAVGQFITDAINEKLERDDKFRQAIKLARLHEPTYPAMFKHTPNDIIRQVFPPIELKNLKDPE